MKRILFLIPTLGFGGAERVLVNLANRLDKRKYDVTIQTLFDVGIYQNKIDKDFRYIPGLKHYFRGNTKLMTFFSPRLLFRFFVKDRYDLIISYLEGSAARIVSGCPEQGTKKIAWIHIEQETSDRAASSFQSIKEATYCYSHFDRIVAVSESVLADFDKVLRVGVPKSVIYNVVESEEILRMADEAVEDVNFNTNEINVVSVAKLMKTKGYDRLIQVLPRFENVHLYLLGCGEEQEALEKLAKELYISERVTFVGFRDNPYKYVKNADLYVCSSRREGFSTAVTEALIVGTPVVSTDCSGAVELLGKNNEYGVVVENSEKGICQGIKMMLNEKTRQHYREKAKERGRFFSSKQQVATAEKLFDKVLAE